MGHPPAPSRPEPMNASPHHPKVRVSVVLPAPARERGAPCAAGGALAGTLEVECKADKGLALGVIRVELIAIEGVF